MAGELIRLPRTDTVRRRDGVTVRRSHFALLGAVLALVAMLGLTALTSWHSAIVHDEDPVHAVSVGRVTGLPQPTDPDRSIHVAAHATSQLLPVGESVEPSAFATVSAPAWPVFDARFRNSRDPSELLRPPRG